MRERGEKKTPRYRREKNERVEKNMTFFYLNGFVIEKKKKKKERTRSLLSRLSFTVVIALAAWHWILKINDVNVLDSSRAFERRRNHIFCFFVSPIFLNPRFNRLIDSVTRRLHLPSKENNNNR